MSMTDPIADFLSRIRNGIMARHAEVVAPASKLKEKLCELLESEGYIAGHAVRDADGFGEIVVRLRWADPRTNAITGLRRRSRLGIAILSTSKGLMTDRAARKAGLGGELLCEVW
jgi:small subunit ribosomal protein S8